MRSRSSKELKQTLHGQFTIDPALLENDVSFGVGQLDFPADVLMELVVSQALLVVRVDV